EHRAIGNGIEDHVAFGIREPHSNVCQISAGLLFGKDELDVVAETTDGVGELLFVLAHTSADVRNIVFGLGVQLRSALAKGNRGRTYSYRENRDTQLLRCI